MLGSSGGIFTTVSGAVAGPPAMIVGLPGVFGCAPPSIGAVGSVTPLPWAINCLRLCAMFCVFGRLGVVMPNASMSASAAALVCCVRSALNIGAGRLVGSCRRSRTTLSATAIRACIACKEATPGSTACPSGAIICIASCPASDKSSRPASAASSCWSVASSCTHAATASRSSGFIRAPDSFNAERWANVRDRVSARRCVSDSPLRAVSVVSSCCKAVASCAHAAIASWSFGSICARRASCVLRCACTLDTSSESFWASAVATAVGTRVAAVCCSLSYAACRVSRSSCADCRVCASELSLASARSMAASSASCCFCKNSACGATVFKSCSPNNGACAGSGGGVSAVGLFHQSESFCAFSVAAFCAACCAAVAASARFTCSTAAASTSFLIAASACAASATAAFAVRPP